MEAATGTQSQVHLTPVVRQIIADSITPISAYRALAGDAVAVLLESVEGHERLARFSFIGLDPIASESISATPDLLPKVRAFIKRFHIEGKVPLPYTGGVVAVFAYEAAYSIENVGTRPPADAAIPDVYCLMPGTWVVFDHFTHRLSCIGMAQAGEEEAVGVRLDAYIARLLDAKASLPGEVKPLGPMNGSIDRDAYLRNVAKAQQLITDGDVYQLQLGIRFSCPIAGDPFDFYRSIRARNPSPYMFYVNMPFGAIFGASPEFLVRLDNGKAMLRPLAGTRGRGATPEEDAAIATGLLEDPKERAEHVMLVDLGRNDLGNVARIGSIQVDELMVIERYSHVMHIVSNVRAELAPQHDALDLFAASFPAGTVTGTPKIRAMQRISQLEPVARGFYAGSVAHFDFNGNMDSCITLRSVQVSNGIAYWQASAGIVADSDPESEFREVFHKTAIVRSVLGLSERYECASS
jgi:anthranilate synthase component 1